MTSILFYDLETSGLDHNRDFILEIAAIVVSPALDPIAMFSSCVDNGPIESLELNEFARKSHSESGLLDELRAGRGIPQARAEELLLAFLDEHSFTENIVLAGHSPHTVDTLFTKRRMPRVAARLSHRVRDVSALVRSYQAYVDPSFEGGKVDSHRALPDALGALESMRRWRDVQVTGLMSRNALFVR